MLELNKLSPGAFALRGEIAELESDLARIREEFDNFVLGEQGDVSLDVTELETVNSAILSLLLCFMRSAARNNLRLNVNNISTSLFDMARVGGLEALLSGSET